ncbi:MAG: hypothetical protein ABI704_17810 [Kofleriaceae bacterium]
MFSEQHGNHILGIDGFWLRERDRAHEPSRRMCKEGAQRRERPIRIAVSGEPYVAHEPEVPPDGHLAAELAQKLFVVTREPIGHALGDVLVGRIAECGRLECDPRRHRLRLSDPCTRQDNPFELAIEQKIRLGLGLASTRVIPGVKLACDGESEAEQKEEGARAEAGGEETNAGEQEVAHEEQAAGEETAREEQAEETGGPEAAMRISELQAAIVRGHLDEAKARTTSRKRRAGSRSSPS